MVEHNYDSRLAQLERRRRRKRKLILKRIICFLMLLSLAAGAVFGGVKIYKTVKGEGNTSASSNLVSSSI